MRQTADIFLLLLYMLFIFSKFLAAKFAEPLAREEFCVAFFVSGAYTTYRNVTKESDLRFFPYESVMSFVTFLILVTSSGRSRLRTGTIVITPL